MKVDKENKISYQFVGELWKYDGPGGWHFVNLPSKLSTEIRKNHPGAEEGWGRLKSSVIVGKTSWDTAIWFDRKLGTYLLPIKASIRKTEGLLIGQEIPIQISIRMD